MIRISGIGGAVRFLSALNVVHSEPEHATVAVRGDERLDGSIVLLSIGNFDANENAAACSVLVVTKEQMRQRIVTIDAEYFIELESVVSSTKGR